MQIFYLSVKIGDFFSFDYNYNISMDDECDLMELQHCRAKETEQICKQDVANFLPTVK